ncbi:MAG: SH3 domain-containing protein [Lachnospiraceae bacterium]|nr:SH3 domain-containing protein [Lachnospiraceae bacterium]
MKHTIKITLFLFLFLLAGGSTLSHAASDDPGAGRLSGEHIPAEFYDTDATVNGNLLISPLFGRYGGFTTSNPYTNKTYTHVDVFADRTIRNGVDVSQWQGAIDWSKVKAAGIDFAIIRVGYRGYGAAGTLSDATKDTYFEANMQGAIAAGLQVGVYIFSQAITIDEAKAEAQYILDRIGSYPVTLPLVMDYEYASDSPTGGRIKTANLSKQQATNICLAFCDTIQAAGYTPMIYANKSMLESQLNASTLSARSRIWLANYTTATAYGGTYDFWQYASDGTVNGISGKVDMNYYYSKADDNFSQGAPIPIPEQPATGTSLSSAVIAPIPDQIYTGSNITPALNVTLNDIPLTAGTDYTVSYQNNQAVGTATVEITGQNQYHDTQTVTFHIVPQAISGLKVKKKSASYVTLSWTKNTTVTGYEIYRSTAQNGTYTKVKTISSHGTTTFKNTGLANGQCYYYKVRAYKTIGKTSYYGADSPVCTAYTNTGYTRLALAKSSTVLYGDCNTGSSVIASPAVNTAMTVTYATADAAGNTWYHVTYKTHSGFVRAGKVTIGKQGQVNGSKINVRKSYSTSSKRLTTLNKNKKVTVLKSKKKKGMTWYKVTFKKGSKYYTGWMAAYYVKIV